MNPTASGEYPGGNGKEKPKGRHQKQHTSNLERNPGGKFFLLWGTQKVADPEPMWRYSGNVTQCPRDISQCMRCIRCTEG